MENIDIPPTQLLEESVTEDELSSSSIDKPSISNYPPLPVVSVLRRKRSLGKQNSKKPSHAAMPVVSEQLSLKERPAFAAICVVTNPFMEILDHTIPIWLDDYYPDATGYKYQQHHAALYVLNDFSPPRRFISMLDPIFLGQYNFNSSRFYIELFFLKQFFTKGRVDKPRSTLRSSAMAWQAFAQAIKKDSVQWMNGFIKKRDDFIKNTLIGIKYYIHTESINNGFYCGVQSLFKCPFCHDKAPTLFESDFTMSDLPSSLKDAMVDLGVRMAPRSTQLSELMEKKQKLEEQSEKMSAEITICKLETDVANLQKRCYLLENTLKMQQNS